MRCCLLIWVMAWLTSIILLHIMLFCHILLLVCQTNDSKRYATLQSGLSLLAQPICETFEDVLHTVLQKY